MGPYPLNADVFEHLPHKVGDSAHNTVVGEIGMTGLNEGHVVRHISVPESEERVLDTTYYAAFVHDPEGNNIEAMHN